MSKSRFRKTKPRDGERRPITPRHCWQLILLGLGLGTFGLTAAFLLHDVGQALLTLTFFMPCFYGISYLRRLRRGERLETVFLAPTAEQAKEKATKIRVGALLSIAAISILFLPMALMAGAELRVDPGMQATMWGLLGMTAVVWVVGVEAYRRAEVMGHHLKSELRTAPPVLAATMPVSDNHVALPATETITPASRTGHWWTDTQTREETKVTVQR